MNYEYVIDDVGAPALLLAGAAREVPTKSGNPAHEIATGRFGAGWRKPKGDGARAPVQKDTSNPNTPPPPAATRDDVVRRRDAVVDAARTLTDLSPDGVRELVRRRWRGTKVLTEADVEAFAADAQRQRVEDVVDALDYRLRRATSGRSAGKAIKVDFPRGVIKGSLRGMDTPTVVNVLQRLRYRGWTADQISRHVVKTFDDPQRRLAAELGALR